MRDTKVIVVGAGIGGLAAALALARAGQRVRVFEQVATIGEVGAGLSITPNAGRALIHLGLGEQLAAIGSTPPVGAIRHYATGEILVTLAQDQSREKYGVPLYHVHRADLHAALAAALRAAQPDAIATGRALESLEQGERGVVARFADGSTASADCLVGCDGIHSATRRLLFGADRPNFTGYVAWRGLIPGELVAADLLDPPLCMTVGPRRMLMRYPLRRGTLVNYVAIARRAAWTEEGWSVRATVSEVLDEFADFEPRVRRLLELTPADRLFKWGLFDRDPLPTWTRGRVSLLGDAAHPMPPFTGQGAVMALEDAAILGRAFAAAGTPTEALQRYETARHARVVAALHMSRARSELYFADDPQQQVRALGAGMAELRTLYDYDVATVAV
jgi:salicylate hydroxylase